MSPLFCILLITCAGVVGGVTNAFLSGNGFALPQWRGGVWCPGALSNIFIGAVSALCSWALYGAGASIDLARLSERQQIGMQLSAVVGALLVGMSGARWLTNEADKRMLKETMRVARAKQLSDVDCGKIADGTPREMLEAVLSA